MSTNPQMLPMTPPRRIVRSAPRHAVASPLNLATALFYVMLIPEQANINLGGLMMSPYRLFLIPVFLYLLNSAIVGRFRFAWPDVAVSVACAWIWLASYMTGDSIIDGVVQGGAHTLDIALPYFVARFAIRTPTDFRRFLVLIAPGVAVMGSVVFLEAVLGRHLIQPVLASITGNPLKLGVEFRMGLLRGAASFPHPILAGICLASFLTLYLMAGLRGWPKVIGAIGAMAGFFTMSSAALLGLFVGGGLLAYDWLAQRVANLSWRLFFVVMTILYVTVELASNSGFFSLLVRYASLNTVSAYNRVLIWQFGSGSVIRNPVFGIGYSDWERPDWMQWPNSFSVDHFWLLSAMRFGLPLAILLILAVAGAVIRLSVASSRETPLNARLMRGLSISLAVFALGAVSVALWANALVWFFMLVGIAVSLGAPPEHQLLLRYRPNKAYPLSQDNPRT